MIQRLRNRIEQSEGQGGFTLIELLVVIIIIGILLAVAVPSYLGFRDRANNSAAKANVRSAVPAVEAYYADRGNYDSMSLAGLQAIDPAIKVAVVSAAGATYCIRNSEPSAPLFYKNGPAGAITTAACT
jgi:type IV pilus assembly protein PilA